MSEETIDRIVREAFRKKKIRVREVGVEKIVLDPDDPIGTWVIIPIRFHLPSDRLNDIQKKILTILQDEELNIGQSVGVLLFLLEMIFCNQVFDKKVKDVIEELVR